MKKSELEKRIIELEKRVAELEARPSFMPNTPIVVPSPFPSNPFLLPTVTCSGH